MEFFAMAFSRSYNLDLMGSRGSGLLSLLLPIGLLVLCFLFRPAVKLCYLFPDGMCSGHSYLL